MADGFILFIQVLIVGTLALLAAYVYDTVKFHRAHQSTDVGQLVPRYPTLIPFFGTIIPLMWNSPAALGRFTWVVKCILKNTQNYLT